MCSLLGPADWYPCYPGYAPFVKHRAACAKSGTVLQYRRYEIAGIGFGVGKRYDVRKVFAYRRIVEQARDFRGMAVPMSMSFTSAFIFFFLSFVQYLAHFVGLAYERSCITCPLPDFIACLKRMIFSMYSSSTSIIAVRFSRKMGSHIEALLLARRAVESKPPAARRVMFSLVTFLI